VRLARDRATGDLVALKSLNKADMVARGKVGHARDERNALAALAASARVVALKATFQDDDALHLVLEYLPGGDLMTLLMRMDVVPVVRWMKKEREEVVWSAQGAGKK
jgi:serine/threonine kinase 38